MNNILSCHGSERNCRGEIWGYLLKHLNSKDTLEGIAEWWLTTHSVEETVDLVARALSYLCTKGVVHKRNKREKKPIAN